MRENLTPPSRPRRRVQTITPRTLKRDTFLHVLDVTDQYVLIRLLYVSLTSGTGVEPVYFGSKPNSLPL